MTYSDFMRFVVFVMCFFKHFGYAYSITGALSFGPVGEALTKIMDSFFDGQLEFIKAAQKFDDSDLYLFFEPGVLFNARTLEEAGSELFKMLMKALKDAFSEVGVFEECLKRSNGSFKAVEISDEIIRKLEEVAKSNIEKARL